MLLHSNFFFVKTINCLYGMEKDVRRHPWLKT